MSGRHSEHVDQVVEVVSGLFVTLEPGRPPDVDEQLPRPCRRHHCRLLVEDLVRRLLRLAGLGDEDLSLTPSALQ